MKFRAAIAILFLGLIKLGFSQAVFVNGVYTQNFGTAILAAWTDNTTFLGWYYDSPNFVNTQNITAAAPLNTGGQYAYRCNGGSDIKIGTRPSNGSGGGPCADAATSTCGHGIGLRLLNTFGNTIVALQVQYDWFQFSLAQNGGAANSMFFSYKKGVTVTSVTGAGWTNIPPLDFTAPQSSAVGGGSQINGYPCTQTGTKIYCFTVNVPHGEEIMLRWWDPNNNNNDPHLAIDNVTVTAYSDDVCNMVLFADNLKWKVEQEENSLVFLWSEKEKGIVSYDLEYSENNVDFKKAHSLPATDLSEYRCKINLNEEWRNKSMFFRITKKSNDVISNSKPQMLFIKNQNGKITIYSDKVTNEKHFKVYLETASRFSIKVFDIYGRKVFEKPESIYFPGEADILLNNLPDGISVLVCEGDLNKIIKLLPN
ncbi:MAG: hypothetical protein AB7O73_09925 [Bacteroidia bacterium]